MYLMKSKSEATIKKYKGLFKRWSDFAGRNDLHCIPTNCAELGLYLTELLESGASRNVVISSVYAVKFYNELEGHTLSIADPKIKG